MEKLNAYTVIWASYQDGENFVTKVTTSRDLSAGTDEWIEQVEGALSDAGVLLDGEVVTIDLVIEGHPDLLGGAAQEAH